MSKPRALMLHASVDGTAYYRVWLPAKALTKSGTWEVKTLPDDPKVHPVPVQDVKNEHYNPAFGTWQEAGAWADVLLSQRVDNPESLTLLLGLRDCYQKPMVLDMDDDVRNIPKTNPGHQLMRDHEFEECFQRVRPKDVLWFTAKGLQVIHHKGHHFIHKKGTDNYSWSVKSLAAADAMIVSTPELKVAYSDLQAHIYVCRNMIDFEEIQNDQRRAKEKLRIGWFGSYTHYQDLVVLKDVIPAILEEHPHVEFMMAGMIPDYWVKYAERHPDRMKFIMGVKPRDWPPLLTELDFDIGLAPLEDLPFNRCKSELKVLEYGARKVPCVASPVAPYTRCIRQGENGLLASTPQEWNEAITRLIHEEGLRKRLGHAIYEKVVNEFNAATQWTQWADTFEIIMEKFHAKPFQPIQVGAPS